MRAGVNPTTHECEIYLNEDEAKEMQAMIAGASLPQRRMFHKLLSIL
jgi:hypothetical protein